MYVGLSLLQIHTAIRIDGLMSDVLSSAQTAIRARVHHSANNNTPCTESGFSIHTVSHHIVHTVAIFAAQTHFTLFYLLLFTLEIVSLFSFHTECTFAFYSFPFVLTSTHSMTAVSRPFAITHSSTDTQKLKHTYYYNLLCVFVFVFLKCVYDKNSTFFMVDRAQTDISLPQIIFIIIILRCAKVVAAIIAAHAHHRHRTRNPERINTRTHTLWARCACVCL